MTTFHSVSPRFFHSLDSWRMRQKHCFKCKCLKPLEQFYRHPQMADGHLNKCKSCAKADGRAHRAANLAKIRVCDRDRANLAHRVAARRIYAQTPRGKAAHARANQRYRFRRGIAA
jgi:hypothetical protein